MVFVPATILASELIAPVALINPPVNKLPPVMFALADTIVPI